MKNLIISSCLVGVMRLFAADVSVTIDRVQQRWPWETKIDVDFTVPTMDDTADVTLAFADGATALAFPKAAVSGSLEKLAPGSHRVTLDPEVAGYTNQWWKNFTVTVASARETPIYLIVDLTKAKGEDGQIAYLSKTDIKSGAYGTYVENPVSGISSIAWTGVTNDDQYATTKLVLRRIPAGSFMMGSSIAFNKDYVWTNSVTISKDFYIAVFETTQKQWELIMGSSARQPYFTLNGDTRPIENIQYSQVRGTKTSWPESGYGTADDGTFLRLMSDKTGLVFDLPTYAQWQYASNYTIDKEWFNSGKSPKSTASWEASDEGDEVARYKNTAGADIPTTTAKSDYAEIDTDRGTAKVGSYRCNCFGLYDMHGNVWEFLLDWFNNSVQYPAVSTDPTGPATGTAGNGERMMTGGTFCRDARYMRTGFRGGYGAKVSAKQTAAAYLRESGFRAIVMPE